MLIDVDEYEAPVEELDVVRGIQQAREELARGEGIEHEDVIQELRARLPR